MTYGKITSTNGIHLMPNPVHITFANPTETQKAQIAELDNWLECVYTDQPTYDPETQYLTDYWQEENGKAVQHWEVHDIPPEPDTESEESI